MRLLIRFWLVFGLSSMTLSVAAAGDLLSQFFADTTQEEILEPDAAFVVSARAITENMIEVRWDIAEGYYLYQNKFGFSVTDPEMRIADVRLSAGTQKNDPDFGTVWVSFFEAVAELTVVRPSGVSLVPLSLQYQGCKEDTLCYPPQTKLITVGMGVRNVADVADAPPALPSGVIASRLFGGSLLGSIIAFFGFGLLLSFTPCVLPMIPILSGIIVGHGTKITTVKAFYLSLVYVLTVACTYAVLGVIAGSFSLNLQAAAQNVWLISGFSLVFVLLAFSMFGFYDLRVPLPSSWQKKFVAGEQGHSLKGVVSMAVVSAIMVGPCITPPLAAALLYISQTGDAVLGGLALFSMGLGMGVPLLIIGVSAGKLLPKVGLWMVFVQYVFGVLMLCMAIWFLERILPSALVLSLWSLLLIVCAVYMGAFESTDGRANWYKLWRGLGLLFFIYGVILLLGVAQGGVSVLRPLQGMMGQSQQAVGSLSFQRVKGLADLQTVLAEAKQKDQPMMLDFYADWCVTCKEMEHGAFSDPQVQQLLQGFLLVQVDVTKNDSLDKELLQEFSLYGPPAMLFFNRSGQEDSSHRVIGFMNVVDFRNHVQSLAR